MRCAGSTAFWDDAETALRAEIEAMLREGAAWPVDRFAPHALRQWREGEARLTSVLHDVARIRDDAPAEWDQWCVKLKPIEPFGKTRQIGVLISDGDGTIMSLDLWKARALDEAHALP